MPHAVSWQSKKNSCIYAVVSIITCLYFTCMWNTILAFIKDFINILYPSICYACGNHLYEGEEHICITCRMSLPYTFDEHNKYNQTYKVFKGRIPIRSASSLLYFKKKSKVQNLLHYLKYKGSEELGIVLGKFHGDMLSQSELFSEIDMIIPVPLHPTKKKKRGYNQAQLLAKGYSEAMGVELNEKVLIRINDTSTQTKKSRYQRYENMSGVFQCLNVELISGKNILLIDDVITTGSTLEACAETLIKSGCSGVWIASAAIA